MLRSRHHACAILLTAILAAPPLALAAPGRYTVSVIPGLNTGAYTSSGAVRINSTGQAAGFYNAYGAHTYFVYDGATTTRLPGITADSDVTMGFNDRGDFVGSAWSPDAGSRSFLYRNGQVAYLPDRASAINNSGQIAVMSYAPQRAGIYENGTTSWLAIPPGSDYMIAEGMNNHGQLTGTYGANDGDGEAFLTRDGKVVDLGLSGFLTYGTDINDRGDVVGNYWQDGVGTVPFFYHDGKASLLPTVGLNGEAHAVNNLGSIVGMTGRAQAALWENGEAYLLSELLDGPAWDSLEVRDINDAGQMAGTACRGLTCHAVIFNPVSAVPEAPHVAMLGIGLLALLGVRRRNGKPLRRDKAQPGSKCACRVNLRRLRKYSPASIRFRISTRLACRHRTV